LNNCFMFRLGADPSTFADPHTAAGRGWIRYTVFGSGACAKALQERVVRRSDLPAKQAMRYLCRTALSFFAGKPAPTAEGSIDVWTIVAIPGYP
jgi:hypothetical protein